MLYMLMHLKNVAIPLCQRACIFVFLPALPTARRAPLENISGDYGIFLTRWPYLHSESTSYRPETNCLYADLKRAGCSWTMVSWDSEVGSIATAPQCRSCDAGCMPAAAEAPRAMQFAARE